MPRKLVRHVGLVAGLVVVGAVLVTSWTGARVTTAGQEATQTLREFTVSARKYAFAPTRIEVNQDDLVQITLTSTDIAHSFTIDGYRIAKRVGGGQKVIFEFRADQPGEFRFYCNLKQDERCKEMQGKLVVHPK